MLISISFFLTDSTLETRAGKKQELSDVFDQEEYKTKAFHCRKREQSISICWWLIPNSKNAVEPILWYTDTVWGELSATSSKNLQHFKITRPALF